MNDSLTPRSDNSPAKSGSRLVMTRSPMIRSVQYNMFPTPLHKNSS